MVSVAVRAAPVFAATVMVAAPEPVPLVEIGRASGRERV
jgi:hypothetical protein